MLVDIILGNPGDLGSGRSHGNAQANTQAGGHFLRQHPIRVQLKTPFFPTTFKSTVLRADLDTTYKVPFFEIF